MRLMKFKKALTVVLVVVAWFWTAYECDTIGIDVFDMLLKRFPGQVWIMAAVLSYLTVIWMPKNLLTRAVMGIFRRIARFFGGKNPDADKARPDRFPTES